MMTAAEFQCALDQLGLDDEAASWALGRVGFPMTARMVRNLRRGRDEIVNPDLGSAVRLLQLAADDEVEHIASRHLATGQTEIVVYLTDEETVSNVPGVCSARQWRHLAARVARDAGLRVVYPFEVSGEDGVEVASRASRSD